MIEKLRISGITPPGAHEDEVETRGAEEEAAAFFIEPVGSFEPEEKVG